LSISPVKFGADIVVHSLTKFINGASDTVGGVVCANKEFIDSCKKVVKDRDVFYHQLFAIPGMKVFKPDANYIFCRLPDDALSGPEVTKRLFIEYNIYIKDSNGKTQPEADRYIRIASRTQEENSKLIDALLDVMYKKN
jgi:histidinol-phosphate/aromatic aminotransferase/cobyric acid decarboxylase-like protein